MLPIGNPMDGWGCVASTIGSRYFAYKKLVTFIILNKYTTNTNFMVNPFILFIFDIIDLYIFVFNRRVIRCTTSPCLSLLCSTQVVGAEMVTCTCAGSNQLKVPG
jgi:hypothetical protein